MKFVFSLLTLALVSSCSSISSSPRKFVIEESWVRSTTAKEFIGYRRMNRMAPLIYKNMLIQSNSIDGIVSYNRVTGNEFWRLNLRNGVEGGAVIAEERLYFGASNGNFYCVDPANGKVLWSFATHVETLAAPTVEKSIVYFETATGVVYALDAITGKQLWLYNRGTTQSLTVRASTQPVIDGENLLVGFSDGFLVSLRKRDGILVWDKKLAFTGRFKDVDSTPVLDDNRLYVSSFDGALYCLKRENGEVIWQHDEGGYTAAVILQDRLFYATTNGLIQALDKVSGKVLWSHPVKKGIAT
jgi:outer membrane protein assembly factor BamB